MIKDLWRILVPKIKPYREWTEEDKMVAVYFGLIIILFWIGGLIQIL